MRFEPRVGTKAWFGPRRDGLGWGWSPVSREGWIAYLVLLPVLLLAPVLIEGTAGFVIVAAAAATLIGLGLAKGSSPGWREDAEAFDRYRGTNTFDRAEGRRLRDAQPDEPSLGGIVRRWDNRR